MRQLIREVGAAAIAVATLIAMGCRHEPATTASTPSPTGPRQGGQVIVGVPADVSTFNEYQWANEATEFAIIDMMFPSLMAEQPDYQLHPPSFAPRLATSWEFSQDSRTLTFTLRKDAVWSDGVPVTAEDVRFSFQVQKDPRIGSPGLEIKDFIASVEVVDPFTVRFHFTRVYPYQLMDANDGHIVPAHAWGKVPFERWRDTDFERIMVTSGPFRLASHTRQQTLVLQRDPTYWGSPRPYLERLVFRVIPEIGSQLAQLAAGQIHLVLMVPPREAPRVRASPDLELVEVPSRTWAFVAWNNRHTLFADRRVRRALSLGINRKSIVDTAYHGFARLANGPVLSSMWAYNRTLPVLPYDPAQARALLAEAGWRDTNGDGVVDRNGRPFEFELLYAATNSIRQEISLLIQSDLARIGVNVRPTAAEYASQVDRQDRGDYEAAISAWEEATKVDLASAWMTQSDVQGTNNIVGYSNPEVDRLITASREENDVTHCKILYDRIQELIVEDQPVTFLYESTQLVGINRRVRGADINASSVFFNLEDWYWSP